MLCDKDKSIVHLFREENRNLFNDLFGDNFDDLLAGRIGHRTGRDNQLDVRNIYNVIYRMFCVIFLDHPYLINNHWTLRSQNLCVRLIKLLIPS